MLLGEGTSNDFQVWISLFSPATAAAKSLQLCPTLCDPIDSSPPGFSIHGIFQARVLEWGAIAFSVHGQLPIGICQASLVAQMVKNLPAMRETRVQSLDGEHPLGEGMATHSSTPAWRSPWREEPGELQSMGSERVGHH